MPLINLNPIKLYLHDIVTNPAGRKSAYLARREDIILSLKNKYNKLLLKHKKFVYKVYKVNNSYYFHFKIPSESYDKLFYDVVLEFYPESNEVIDDKNLNRYYVRMFSNSPAFMFTYTYVCNNNKMIPSGLTKFCSKTALREAPTVKNPVEIYGYEKSVFFACLYIIENKLYIKFNAEKNLYKFKPDTFDNTIQSQEFKLAEYNKCKEKAKKDARKEKIQKINKAKERTALQKKKPSTSTAKKKTKSTTKRKG